MYTDDMRTMLNHTEKQIDEIRSDSKNGTVNAVQVKNTLENLRSTLDYIASDLRRRTDQSPSANEPVKVYFPYGQRENHFKISLKTNLPKLQAVFPKIYEIIEAAQPFKSGDSWIVDLSRLTNEVKHNNLARTSVSTRAVVRQPGIHVSGTNIVMEGNSFNGVPLDNVYVGSDGSTVVSGNSGLTWVLIEKTIKFQEKNVEVAPFLARCHLSLVNLSTAIGKCF